MKMPKDFTERVMKRGEPGLKGPWLDSEMMKAAWTVATDAAIDAAADLVQREVAKIDYYSAGRVADAVLALKVPR